MLRQLFQTKSIDRALAETGREGTSLRKVLGSGHLVALGVGAIIGTGVFATIGTASGGDANRLGAGPALMVSFVLTAIVCAFTGLCYAEFASMVPAAGSAYTYAYATLGELVAWIIGWDLLLEYAIGNTAVAISWAGYADAFLRGLGVNLPRWLVTDFRTAAKIPAVMASAPHVLGVPIVFNGLAFGIVALVTMVLVWGVKESARFNGVMVAIKVVVLAFFVLACTRYVRPDNWHPFAPNGLSGIGAGAAVIFVAYIGFDAVSTCAEECKNPGRDMPIGILGSLAVCTVIYVGVAAVFTGLVPYAELASFDSSKRAEALAVAMEYAKTPHWMVGVVALGSVVAQTSVLLVFQLGQPRILFAHGARRPPSTGPVACSSEAQDASRLDDPDGRARRRRQCLREHRRDGRPDEHRNALRVRPRLHRHHGSSQAGPGPQASFPRPLWAVSRASSRRDLVPRPCLAAAAIVLYSVRRLARRGSGRLQRLRSRALTNARPARAGGHARIAAHGRR